MNFIRFEPCYADRVWGGKLLERHLKRHLPPGRSIGESWEISDNPAVRTKIKGGRFDGKTLGEAIKEDSEYIMGRKWEGSFPVIVKWLDSCRKLSLQVHPDEISAKKFGADSKAENWYFAKCGSNAKAILGLKEGTDRNTLERFLKDGNVEEIVREFPVEEGDSAFIPKGLLHALDGENLVLEIQDNSDTTFRVFDWGRVDLNGKPRQLHLSEAMESVKFSESAPQILKTGFEDAELCSSSGFSIRKKVLKAGEELYFESRTDSRILSVVAGSLLSCCGEKVDFSESVLLPFGESQRFTAPGNSELIITENFSSR